MTNVGDEIELEVTGIAHGGAAVGRDADGRVVFVADAIPGERIIARLTEAKKSFARADAISVIDASPHRVEHIWPEAGIDRHPKGRPGGAEFGHIALPHQRELKARVLRESLARFAKLELDTPVEAAPGDDERGGLGWRTRVRLHVDETGRPGPYAARSHRVIAVDALPLADRRIQDSGLLGERFPGQRSIEVIAPSRPDGDDDLGVRLIIGEQKPSVIIESVAFADGVREFRVDDTGFWQVHRAAPALLAAATRAAIDPDRFDPAADNLDLYGGVGLLAAAMLELGGQTTRVTTVESEARATLYAELNLVDFAHAEAETGRVDRWLSAAIRDERDFRGATIVLDPPRAGAGGEVTTALTTLGAAQLVYVACDPVAFARDAATLEAGGYRLSRLGAYDLFPHTHHIEAIATFVPA